MNVRVRGKVTLQDRWIRYGGVTYELRPGERALDAMLRGGAPIRFSCRKGSCRSCLLQVTSGDPGAAAVRTLPDDMRAAGFFLPCSADAPTAVEAVDPDLSLCRVEAMVAEKSFPAPGILRLALEPARQTDWQGGQSLTLIAPDGTAREYSITSLPEDYFLTLDIRVYPGGRVSGWLAETVGVGDTITFQGPGGNFVYAPEMRGRPLLFVATGTGGGAAIAVARSALAAGHDAPIHVLHGGRTRTDLYLGPELAALAAHGVHVRQVASAEETGEPAAKLTDVLARDYPDLSQHIVFLCGNPDMVEAARILATRAGTPAGQIITDPFDPPAPYQPRDADKLRALKPDPKIWAALDHGTRLTAILEDFYTRVYADPRLAPFFQRVTKARAVEKQYAFLRGVFTASKQYFGEKPFHAHHWMVISDDLFDHREALFFATVRAHGFPEPLIPRWAALHETFRREIVKSAPRGQFRQGTEHDLEGFQDERLDVGTVCDTCQGEIDAGQIVRMHRRTGEIFCAACAGPTINAKRTET